MAGCLLLAALPLRAAPAADQDEQLWIDFAHEFPAGRNAAAPAYAAARVFEGGDVNTWNLEADYLYEYRDRENAGPTWRFRLLPRVKRTMGSSAWSFVGQDEIFYDSAQDRVDQNRLRLGGEHRPGAGSKSSVVLYYLLRSDRRGNSWEKTHVLGSSWTF